MVRVLWLWVLVIAALAVWLWMLNCGGLLGIFAALAAALFAVGVAVATISRGW